MRASFKGLVLAALVFSQLLHQCCCGPVEGGRSLTLKALGQREDGQEVGDTRPERQRLPLGPGEAGGKERPKRFLGAIGRAIGKAVKSGARAVGRVVEGAGRLVSHAVKTVKEGAGRLVSHVREGAGRLVSHVREGAGRLVSHVREGASRVGQIVSRISKHGQRALDAVRPLITLNFATDLVKKLVLEGHSWLTKLPRKVLLQGAAITSLGGLSAGVSGLTAIERVLRTIQGRRDGSDRGDHRSQQAEGERKLLADYIQFTREAVCAFATAKLQQSSFFVLRDPGRLHESMVGDYLTVSEVLYANLTGDYTRFFPGSPFPSVIEVMRSCTRGEIINCGGGSLDDLGKLKCLPPCGLGHDCAQHDSDLKTYLRNLEDLFKNKFKATAS